MEVVPNFSTERAQQDYQLVCRAREMGDQSAFADLMKSYRQPIYLMLLKMINNPTEADDLTIETFGKAFCQIQKYNPVRPFSTWIFSIATNNCIDFIRKKRNSSLLLDDLVKHDDEDGDYEIPIRSEVGNPEEELEREQRNATIRSVIEQMKPRYRRMIEMRYFEELSYEEIATRLSIPIGTVRSQLFRAHELLQNILNNRKDVI